MRISLVASEAATGLRRNLTMTVAAVLVISIALALLGTANLIRQQINEMQKFWLGKVEVSLFLCRDIDSDRPTCPDGAVTDAQRVQIEQDLRDLPQVSDVFYESKQDAYERFQEQFASSEIADSITVDDMQESFRAKLVNPEQDYNIVASAFEGRPGVENVVDMRSFFDTVFDVLNGFQAGALFVAFVALIATVLLIVVVIRVAAFSRRRETSIIRESFAFNEASWIEWSHVMVTCGIVMAIGLLVSIVVSYLTLLKYLRV